MADKSAPQQIDDIIETYGGWKGATLAWIRSAIKQADPEIEEEIKWKMPTRPEGLPVWMHNGNVCLAETFKDNIKLVFVKGAFMTDPDGLFNARLNSSTDRAIEFKEGTAVNKDSLIKLVKQAVDINESKE